MSARPIPFNEEWLATQPEEFREPFWHMHDEIGRLEDDGERLHEANDRLREELDRQAAEIGRLRNKKAQECSNGDGPAVWCSDCLNAAVAAQATRDRGMLPAEDAIPEFAREAMVALTAERDAALRAEDRMRLAMDNRVIDLDRSRISFDRRLRELLDQMRHELTKGEVGT